MNDETAAPPGGGKGGLSGRLIYLLPLITALAAGVWAVVTWLVPHPIPDRTSKPEVAAPAASRAAVQAAPVTASGGGMVITGPVTGSSIRNGGAPDGDRRP